MQFIVKWKVPKGSVVDSEARFLKTGGGPPEGVKMVGRRHGMDGSRVVIAETNDAKALCSWLVFWRDLLEFEVTPCLEDADAGAVLTAVKR